MGIRLASYSSIGQWTDLHYDILENRGSIQRNLSFVEIFLSMAYGIVSAAMLLPLARNENGVSPPLNSFAAFL